MPSNLQNPTAFQFVQDPSWGVVVDRVQASLTSGGCATTHFESDDDFRSARAALRERDLSTQLGSTATGWRA